MDVKVHMMSIPIDMNGNIVPNVSMQGPGQGQRPNNNNNNNNNESGNKVCEPFLFFSSVCYDASQYSTFTNSNSFISSISRIVPVLL